MLPVLILGGYITLVVACITVDASLVKNANRAGRIAVAQIPLVFLFATKNSLLSLVLGPGNGYEKLNFVHKWGGRGIFLGSLIHGTLWIKNHLETFTPIIGQEKEETGIAAFALLCIIVLTSLRPVRRWMYNIFYGLQYVLPFSLTMITTLTATPAFCSTSRSSSPCATTRPRLCPGSSPRWHSTGSTSSCACSASESRMPFLCPQAPR